MRGLAVVVMIQCHTFNSFVRMDLRDGGPYVYSQFVGGMAAPLFLFMAGMTLAFQMESMERRQFSPFRRWAGGLRRAGYVWGIAYLFRFTNWLGSWPNGSAEELTKVDILNCMGLAMAAMAALAVAPAKRRPHFAMAAGLVIAAAAPVVANLSWDGAPRLIHEYLAPGQGRGRFAFFPCAAYVAFGAAVGTIVKRTAVERVERLMQWSVLIGFALVFTAQYFSNVPYSLYPRSNFWTDSPSLILIRTGIIFLLMAAAYLWTEYCAGSGWSWMQALGKTSLMAYWIHVMLVYGQLANPFRRALDIPHAGAAAVSVTALMSALAGAKLWWGARNVQPRKAAAAA